MSNWKGYIVTFAAEESFSDGRGQPIARTATRMHEYLVTASSAGHAAEIVQRDYQLDKINSAQRLVVYVREADLGERFTFGAVPA